MSTTDTTPAQTHTSPEQTHDRPEPALASDVRMATFRLARRLRSQRAIDDMSDAQFELFSKEVDGLLFQSYCSKLPVEAA